MDINTIKYEDLCEDCDNNTLPPVDRYIYTGADFLDKDFDSWWHDGVIIKHDFISSELIDKYTRVREEIGGELYKSGWRHPTPYMERSEILDICLFPDLMNLIQKIFGVEFGLHLNLSGYVSTERDWHPDDYLNPAHVNAWYCAVWMALDDIHAEAGPFEYVPGSHRWPSITRQRVFDTITLAGHKELLDDHNWPALTQGIVGRVCQEEIMEREAETKFFIPKRGDLLIWHARLLHRGSKPLNPELLRKSLISHYSSIQHRSDMPKPIKYTSELAAGYYFPMRTLENYEKYAANPMR